MASPQTPANAITPRSTDALPPDIEKQHTKTKKPSNSTESPPIERIVSAVSTHEIAAAAQNRLDTVVSDDSPIYDKVPHHRKLIITTVLSFAASLAPMSSTAIMSAIPEVSETFNTDGAIVNLSNAAYLVAMGVSPIFWGPLAQIYGRRNNSIICIALFFLFSLASALAPSLASFFVFRILTAFQGTALIILGSACIGDIYPPLERSTALAWFLTGTLVGPTLFPFLAGILVTYRDWRAIFWLQTALAGAACVAVFFCVPETIHYRKADELAGMSKAKQAKQMAAWMSPTRVLGLLFRYPNLLTTAMASSALLWNMYSLLTPIRYVPNPRFGLTSPLQSGLFYIAPGCGYILGTLFGGRYADYVARKYKANRGRRVPEDRLNSSLVAMGIVIPACMVVYGWSIEKRVGGVPLPVVVMFVQGVAQLICFPSVNVYCLDVIQKNSAEVVAGNYALRYLFGAIGTAVCLPAIRKIGVGWFSTVSALFLVVATIGVWITAIYGERWRQWVEGSQTQIDGDNGHVEKGVKTQVPANAGEK